MIRAPLYILALLATLLLFAPNAFAIVGDTAGDDARTISGRGVVLESNEALYDIAVPMFWTSDDAATNNVDTGTEACAQWGMDCHDTYVLDPAGSSGDELTDSTCAADQTDAVISISFCN